MRVNDQGSWWYPGMMVAGGNNNNNNNRDRSTTLLCHYTPVMSRGIYTQPLYTHQPQILGNSPPSLWILRPPPHSNPTEFTPGLTQSQSESIHCTYAWFTDTALWDLGSDPRATPSLLWFHALIISLVKCIFWEAVVSGLNWALQHLSWDRGRRWVDALNFSFILFPLLLHTPPHRSRHSAANSHLLILIHRETDVKAQAKLAKFKYSVYLPLD